MKYKFWAILLCVSICLGMTGCGNEEPEKTSSGEKAVSVSNSNLKPESSVVAVGHTTVTYNEYRTYYYFMKNQYEGTLGEGVWQYSKAIEGNKSIGQEAIESVLRLIIQVKVICKEAAIQKVTLQTDEKEEADYNAKRVYESLAEKVRADNGIDLKVLTNMFEENKLAQKMYNVQIGKVNADLSADQIRAARVQLLYRRANKDNKAEVKAQIEQIRQNMNASGTNFYSTAKTNSDQDEVECLIGNSDERKNLAKAVLELKQGQISNVIEEADGFYIACCMQQDCAEIQQEYRNEVVLKKQIEAFQKEYKKWSDKFEVKVSKALLAQK